MTVDYLVYSVPQDRARDFRRAFEDAEPHLRKSPFCLRYELGAAPAEGVFVVRLELGSRPGRAEKFDVSREWASAAAALAPFESFRESRLRVQVADWEKP